jgi:hypothetical protein
MANKFTDLTATARKQTPDEHGQKRADSQCGNGVPKGKNVDCGPFKTQSLWQSVEAKSGWKAHFQRDIILLWPPTNIRRIANHFPARENLPFAAHF